MKSKYLLLLALAGLVLRCEQDRVDDTRFLHPYSGDEPVLFAFFQSGTSSVTIEAQQTLPYYSDLASAPLTELTGVVRADAAEIGTLFPMSGGRFRAELSRPLSSGTRYHLSCEHPVLGDFRTAAFGVPLARSLLSVDSFRRESTIHLRGNFGSLPAGLSVSCKLLRYGEGRILDNSVNILPVRRADRPLTPGPGTTEEYSIREEFTIFDPELLVPIDTVRVDSVQLILYTWGEEVLHFNRSLAQTGREFGDGSESIDASNYSNVEGGHGLVAGFAADTVTIRLR